MKKEIMVFSATTAISGLVAGIVFGANFIANAWADDKLKDYLTILAFNTYTNSVQKELRQTRIEDTQTNIDRLEFIRDEEGGLTKRQAWELKNERSKLQRLKEK